MRRQISLALAFLLAFTTLSPAFALGSLSISSPTSITYDPASQSFPVTDLLVTGSASYVQVELSLLDSNDQSVDPDTSYRIAVGTQCAFDAQWTNTATSGQVVLSGDNTTNVLIAGTVDDVNAAIQKVWLFRKASIFCGGTGSAKLGSSLLVQKLRVSVIESQQGLWYSSATGHYYQLATQTTDDGMGQPTDSQGNVTDASRYFVRWSTARANAKASTITIGGFTHQGYLAAITTKSEFNFLNRNVSGGSGVLYPAWVGGSDAMQEGYWRWVDGPEAKRFGGDVLTSLQDVTVDPEGNRQLQDLYGFPYITYPNGRNSILEFSALIMRDNTGAVVVDSTTGYKVEANLDSGTYCSEMFNNYGSYMANYYNNGYIEVDATPYGSYVHCDPNGIYIEDDSATKYFTEYADGASDAFFYYVNSNSTKMTNGYGERLVVRNGTSDFSTSQQLLPDYQGALFWGPDSGTIPNSGLTDFCGHRGVRGICSISQLTKTGGWEYNDYYVHWSNGDKSNTANWDGVKNKPGDGVYAPQPDNAFLNGSPNGENALIINWCARNASDFSNSDAVTQSLYGNTGYRCTPGWNDLAAGDWAGASNTYPNGFQSDTPNEIGTTDYVIEYCGYSDEAFCALSAVSSVTTFSVTSNNCATNSDTTLTATFEAARAETTSLTSSTMNVFTFDDLPTGWMADPYSSNVGTFNGAAYVADAAPIGGAGGVGKFGSMANSYLELPQVSCYVGFWWSAGNATNYVQLLGTSGQVLASFSAQDLVDRLGSCWPTKHAYCGHPEFNNAIDTELFAFVNLRLPAGFKTVRFFGSGFELDNITTSVDIPQHSATETAVTPGNVTTDCSTKTAADADANLVACPRSISIAAGQQLDYDPRVQSQISGYSYPASTALTGVTINSGAGSALLNASSSAITISSDTVGTFYVDFTLTKGAETATSRITVTVTANATVNLVAPSLLFVDPRATSVDLGALDASGSATISLCLRPVSDSNGTPFVGAPSYSVNFPLSSPLSAQTALSDYLVLSGSLSDVLSESAFVQVQSGDRLTVNGSIYLQVSAVSGTAANAAACDAGSSAVIEIRPIEIDLSQSLDIWITRIG